jgi:hypothetical protein
LESFRQLGFDIIDWSDLTAGCGDFFMARAIILLLVEIIEGL